MSQASAYTLTTPLSTDGQIALWRGLDGEGKSALLAVPVPRQPDSQTLARLDREFELRDRLDHDGACRPLALLQLKGLKTLVLEDDGGVPLSRLFLPPAAASGAREVTLDIGGFLSLAAAIADALSEVHRHGLIHKNLSPAIILYNPDKGSARLTGFGHASSLQLERQAPEPVEELVGSLEYMAPEQTGRMNRSLDQRGDLYSLGIIFYQLLTGQLPFTANDPLEWVHCHVARQPTPPQVRRPDCPAIVSDIVMKLLSKAAEERYQTALGLADDLRHCLDQWNRSARIQPFELGRKDISRRLTIPEILYGREQESRKLLSAVGRIISGTPPEVVLVSGYSGVGKSSLVNELHKSIVQPPGIFLTAKVDQYKRDVPYAAISQCFRGFIRQLLSRDEAELALWRDQIRDAVGSNGRLLTDLIPELSFLIGTQPDVPSLSSNEAQNRFNATFRNFVGVFAKPEHPLLLFIDDLQWQDLASLKLVEHLLTHPDLRHMLFIGAYRDNEVHPAHPLMLSVESIRNGGVAITDIVLEPLSVADLGRLVGDTLRSTPERAQPLVNLLHKKTGGNPFFAVQFLMTLHDEGLLAQNPATGSWRWDLGRIRAKGFTDNVVDLMVAKLERMPERTRQALGGLACLGNGCALSTLSLAMGRSGEETKSALDHALRAGYIAETAGRYKFSHDRVQEAAYALITPEERAQEHLRIGRLMAKHLVGNEAEDAVFDIVSHFNRGIELVTDAEERTFIGLLNATAGRKAKSAAAYASARTYLAQAMALAPDDCWERQFERCFQLQLARAECEYVVGELEQAERLFTQLLDRGRTNAERASVYHLLCRSYFSAGRYGEAFEVITNGIAQFGTVFPQGAEEIEAAILQERSAVSSLLAGRSVPELIDTPTVGDTEIRALLGLIADALPVYFVANSKLFVLLVLKGLGLSLRHGVTRDSCAIFSCYSIILIGIYEDIRTGYEFSDLALRLNDKFRDAEEKGRLLYLHGTFVNSWSKPFSASTQIMEQAFLACREVGNLAHAGSALLGWAWLSFEQGAAIETVLSVVDRHAAFAQANHNDGILSPLRHERLFLDQLRGAVEDEDRRRIEDECLATLRRVRFSTGIAYQHIRHQILAYLFGSYEESLDAAEQAASLESTVMGMAVSATHHFFHALALAALYQDADPGRREEIRQAILPHRRKLALWAAHCPENFGCRHALAEAELARIDGRPLEAMSLYEKAAVLAQANGLTMIEGMAHELAARLYLESGLRSVALSCIRQARDCFERWGALAKVANLAERYPDLSPSLVAASSSRVIHRSEDLDVQAVVRASQAVSDEIVYGKLIEKVITIVIEHAGAGRGSLILRENDEYAVAAEAISSEDGIAVSLDRVAVPDADLPLSVVHFVLRTSERVLVDNALLPNPFTGDDYLVRTNVKSILCLPLLKQSKLVGLLYLENRLAAGAFTPDRIAILEHVASQAAISIENATLYAELQAHQAHLQELVDERTTEVVRQKERLNQIVTEQELILNNASLGICTVKITPNRRSLRRVNRSFEVMLGYQKGELEGRDTRPLFESEEEYQKFSAIYETVIQSGKTYRGEHRYRRKDGEIILVSMVGSAVAPKDLSKGTIWLVEDITERKRAERAQADTNAELRQTLEALREAQQELVESEKLASLGAVVAGVAHEVNTPLGVGVTAASLIRSETRTLARKFEDNALKKTDLATYLETLTQSSQILESNLERAAELIRSFKQVAVDQTSEDTRRIELGGYLNDVVSSLKPALRKAGHSIAVNAPNDLWLETTPSAIWQIVSNLVMNSIIHAYEPGQRGQLAISAERTPKGLALSYSDNGKGMEAEVKRHIFDPFFTTKRGHGGSGLGLSIVYNLVTKTLAGSISCKSTPGNGCQFLITIPMRELAGDKDTSAKLVPIGRG